jgi:hypothetical protein
VVGDITRRAESSTDLKVSNASVPDAILRPGPTGLEALTRYQRAGGSMPAARDALAMKARASLVKADGSLDTGKLAGFRSQYSRVLSHPDMQPLNSALQTAEGAENAFSDVAARAKAQVDEFQKSAAGRFLGAASSQDVTRQVAGLFGTRNSVAQLGSLRAEMGKDDAAVAGMRRAIVQHIESNYIGNTEVGTSGDPQIKANAFKTFMRQNEQGLLKFFTPNEVKTMADVGADMTRAARSGNVIKPPNEAATAHNQELVKKHYNDVFTIVRHLLAPAGASTIGFLGDGVTGLVAGLSVGLSATVLNAMRNAGMSGLEDLKVEDFLHPELARILMAKATPQNAGRLLKGLSHAIIRAAAVNFAQQSKQSGYGPDDSQPVPAPIYGARPNALSVMAPAGP